MQHSTPPTPYSSLTASAPSLIPCPAPVARVWTPSKRPRPLCHGDMTAADIQEGVVPIYDVQFMPFSDGRYKKTVESQQDYLRGGYAKVTLGQRLNYERYEITAKLGVGHFGVVYLAWDRIDGRYVAIKIVRSSTKYARAAMAEDKLLTVIQGPMDDRKEFLVEYLDCFELEAAEGDLFHVCLVFEVLGISLLEVLRKNEFNGFPLRTAKHIIRQILESISYLHSMDIIHTDIKPDNILLSHGNDIESMLTAQLKAQAHAAEAELQKEIDEGLDPLNTAGRVKTWHDYYKKIPDATLEQEETIAKKRFDMESRKWPILRCTPVESEIGFMKGTMVSYRPSKASSAANESVKDKDSPLAQTQNLGDTVKKPKTTNTKQQRSSPSHPSKPKVTTSNLTATAPQAGTLAISPITLPPSAPAPAPTPIPFNFYSENADTPDKPSQPTVWDQAIADSGYSGSRVIPLSPAEMASSIGLRNGGYSSGFKPPLLYSGLMSRNSSASPTTRLHKDFENISLGLASYQQDDDDLDTINNNDDPIDDFGVDMLEMRTRRPLTRNGSQRSIAGSICSSSSSSSNLASGGTGGSSLFTNRTGGTATTAGVAYNYGYGTPTITSSPEIGFMKSPTSVLGISGLNRTRNNRIPGALPYSQQAGQATVYNNSTGFSCPSPETTLSSLPMHPNYAVSPRQGGVGGYPTASPLSHLSNYFISPTSLASNGQRAFPYTSLSGSPAQSFLPTTTSLGMSAELASTSFGERHPQGQGMMTGLGLAFAQQHQFLHGTGPGTSTAVKPFNTPPPKRANTSSTSLDEGSTSGSTPTRGTPENPIPNLDDPSSPAQKVLPDLSNTKIKLADLGNAIFFGEMKGRNALPEFVCTRQYRPPENLIGAPYDQGIDIWATACVVFEMLTGDLLFNPGSKRFKWSKEDDLLAQQIELLGPLPQHLLNTGKKTSHYFTPTGKLLKLKLKPWSLKDVLVEKYKMSTKQAEDLADFLLPMLAMDPAARCSADEALQHPWLSSDPDDDTVLYRTPPPVLKLADPEVERKKREERAIAREKEEALLVQWREEARKREEEYERLEMEKKRLQEEEEDKRFWAQEREREKRRNGIFDPPKDQDDDDSYPWGYPLRRYP